MAGPSENSIRRLWERLTPATLLHTSDDRPLIVLSSGAPNSDGGPDYTDALIRLDGRLYRGDVEVHGHERDWELHHHHTDAHYNKVVLHVVGRQGGVKSGVHTAGKRLIPTLVLHPDEQVTVSSLDTPPSSPRMFPQGTSCNSTACTVLRRMLLGLGWKRLEYRILALDARLNELLRDAHWSLREAHCMYRGNRQPVPPTKSLWTKRELDTDEVWDQLVFEGIAEGMGYAKNTHPFRSLAQNLPLDVLRRWGVRDHDDMAALLFGASGLLPSTRGLPERESRRYVLCLRRRWNELRKALHCPVIHEANWLFFRLRPANFPTARLAALSYVIPRLLHGGAARELLKCFHEPGLTSRSRLELLRQFFAFTPDGFWATHLHFRSTAPGPSIALGIDRIDAIIFNTLLPISLLRARLFADHTLHVRATAMARMMPVPPPNNATRAIERNVLNGRLRIGSALLHHGAIELSRRYCEAGRCGECPIAELTP